MRKAIITIRTEDGELVAEVTADELDHVNVKEYLNEVYHAVDTAIRTQGGFTL